MSDTPFTPRVLVVDDSDDNLMVLQGILEDRYDVIAVGSGRDAFTQLRASPPPDVILLDIMMPGMDGYEVLRRLRQDPLTAGIPVIFATAMAAPQHEQLGLDLGAIDYITKPIDPLGLLARLEVHVQRSRRQQRLDELGTRLAPHLHPAFYESIFGEGGRDRVRFQELQAHVVYAEAHGVQALEMAQRLHDEARRLADRFGGRADLYAWDGMALVFEDRSLAAEAHEWLCKAHADDGVRLVMRSMPCVVALFELGTQASHALVGETIDQLKEAAASAAGGRDACAFDPMATQRFRNEAGGLHLFDKTVQFMAGAQPA